MISELGRLLAYIRPDGESGPILAAESVFAEEVQAVGADVAEHNFPHVGHVRGLLIFEGWVETTPGDDSDVLHVGEWRRLTHWELCRVRAGMLPWDGER